MEPHQHRVNAAKRAIQTFKNHFLAGLATIDINFPIQLWDNLLQQAQDSLNLLRATRLNPNISAYAMLEGEYNFNKTPLAPPRTKALIHQDPDSRTSWGPHALDAWYVGNAKDPYRCYKVWLPSTRGYRVTQTIKFFPTHLKMPGVSNKDNVIITAIELTKALLNKNTSLNIQPKQLELLKQLADIFETSATPQRVNKDGTTPQVYKGPTTSVDVTSPNVLSTKRFIHQKQTIRANTTITSLITDEIEKPPINRPESSTSVTEIRQEKTPPNLPLPICTPDEDTPQHRRQSNRLRQRPGYVKVFQAATQVANQATHMTADENLNFHIDLLQANQVNQAVSRAREENQNLHRALHHICNGVVHPTTGETITKYAKLAADPATREIWQEARRKELGRLAQGYKNTPGTNIIKFLSLEEIANIPKDRVVTYTIIVVDFRPQKDDPNRV